MSRQTSSKCINANGINIPYYFDWEGAEDFSEYDFDDRGLPLVDYGSIIGQQYNPVTISQFGLFNFNAYLITNHQKYEEIVLTCARWLVENYCELKTGAAVWYYNFDLDFYSTKAPWISAMSQGEAISLLLRAYYLTQDVRFIDTADRASIAFAWSINQNGVCSQFGDGSTSLEEFPSNPPSHVLNGAIFALFGLYDYFKCFDNQQLQQIFQNAVTGLAANLTLYDTGYWTRYDLFPVHRLASRAYHETHIRLLLALSQLTGDNSFKNTAQKWARYQHNPLSYIRWFCSKVIEKIRIKLSR